MSWSPATLSAVTITLRKLYVAVQVVVSTHVIGGLSMFDAILAAKIDALPVEYSPKWLRQQGHTNS